MKKQQFTFKFPITGEAITRTINPIDVKAVTTAYLKRQVEVRGEVCIVFNMQEEVVAMAYIDEHMHVLFSTGDAVEEDIKEIDYSENMI